MRPLHRAFASALIAAAAWLPAPSSAQVDTFASAGAWAALAGRTEDGTRTCGVGASDESDGRSFLIHYLDGADFLLVRATNPVWRIRPRSRLPVALSIDGRDPWLASALGAGTSATFRISGRELPAFEAAFRSGKVMRVEFLPLGTVWDLDLRGSSAMSDALAGCMHGLARAGAGQRPSRPPPSPPLSPTEDTPPGRAWRT